MNQLAQPEDAAANRGRQDDAVEQFATFVDAPARRLLHAELEHRLQEKGFVRIAATDPVRVVDHAIEALGVRVGVSVVEEVEDLVAPSLVAHVVHEATEEPAELGRQAGLPDLVRLSRLGLRQRPVEQIVRRLLPVVQLSHLGPLVLDDLEGADVVRLPALAALQQGVTGALQRLAILIVLAGHLQGGAAGEDGERGIPDDVELIDDDDRIREPLLEQLPVGRIHVDDDHLDVVAIGHVPEEILKRCVGSMLQQPQQRAVLDVRQRTAKAAPQILLIEAQHPGRAATDRFDGRLRPVCEYVSDSLALHAKLTADRRESLPDCLVEDDISGLDGEAVARLSPRQMLLRGSLAAPARPFLKVVVDDRRLAVPSGIDEHPGCRAVAHGLGVEQQAAKRDRGGTNALGQVGVLAIGEDVPDRPDARKVQGVGDFAFWNHLVARSRRLSSRSTASRTRSVRSSPGVNTAPIRAKVPSANRATMSSAQRFFRPTRGGVADMTFESQALRFPISVIALISHMRYGSYLILVMEAMLSGDYMPNVWPTLSRAQEDMTLRVISNGLGVQSLAMIYLADESRIGPMPDYAITGDTGDERTSALENLRMLQGNARPRDIQILVRKDADIRDDLHAVIAGRKKRFPNPPFFIKNPDGSRGILARGCTRDYKIRPVRRELRHLLGKSPRGRMPSRPIVELWIGITTDEVDRMEPSRMPWIYNRYPLIEINWSRRDCERYLERRFA